MSSSKIFCSFLSIFYIDDHVVYEYSFISFYQIQMSLISCAYLLHSAGKLMKITGRLPEQCLWKWPGNYQLGHLGGSPGNQLGCPGNVLHITEPCQGLGTTRCLTSQPHTAGTRREKSTLVLEKLLPHTVSLSIIYRQSFTLCQLAKEMCLQNPAPGSHNRATMHVFGADTNKLITGTVRSLAT